MASNTIKVKGVVSSLMFLLFLLVLITGSGLWLGHSGKIESMHNYSGILLSGFIVLHFTLNIKLLSQEIKTIFKR